MTNPMRVALICAVPLLACEQASEPSGPAGTVSLQVVSTGVTRALDAGRVHIEGPTPRVVDVTPGSAVTIDELLPGTYTVSLEGFAGGEVERFGRAANVQVVAGQTRAVTVTFNPFVATLAATTLTPDGESFTVSFPAVALADSYRVLVDDDAGFASPEAQIITGTSASFPVGGVYGPRFIRVQAYDPYGEIGAATAPRQATLLRLLTVPGLDGWVQGDGTVNTSTAFAALGDAGAPGVVARGFFGFDISPVSPSETITGAVVRIFQAAVLGDPYATLGEVVVDHVDVGPALDAGDYTLAPLTTGVGTISTNATLERKTLVVGAQVAADQAAGRGLSHFRLRFSIQDEDGDLDDDFLQLATAEDPDPVHLPELIVISE